ncbi:C2H2 finger domain protein [Aspergillus fumigatus A1163]|uniref:C2H2 finger domain protein n=1 Tax=Aspergillus fumigatus (strain CBS 144.89 / FGSC A1163 / CEA10) TaxID=451804 RepID=B0YE24_ASPFC|nr:C2H2 finger domain protein [Aspergillus fumigatus A1163]
MPSESTTSVRHVAFDHAGHEHGQTGTFRESPADNQSRWPTLDLLLNPTDDQPSNTCDVPNKSHLHLPTSTYHRDFAHGNEDKPNSSPSEAVFQELQSIDKLLLPPKSTAETISTIFRCIVCSQLYHYRNTLKNHVKNGHLPHPLPLTCVCGRLVCSRDEYLLCFSNHCMDEANRTATEREDMKDSEYWVPSDLQRRTLENIMGSFISRIKQEFPGLALKLIQRFARSQLRQFGRVIGNMKEHAQALELDSCQAGDMCFLKSLPSLVVGASQCKAIINAPSLASTLAKLPAVFECPYCLQIRVFNSTSQWRDHICEDMQLSDCTFADCNGCLNQRQWFRHVSEVHHQSDREYISDKDKGPCCFCGNFSRTLKGLREHLKQHMSHITEILLKPDGELWLDQDIC